MLMLTLSTLNLRLYIGKTVCAILCKSLL